MSSHTSSLSCAKRPSSGVTEEMKAIIDELTGVAKRSDAHARVCCLCTNSSTVTAAGWMVAGQLIVVCVIDKMS
jgi:hypothetical protein